MLSLAGRRWERVEALKSAQSKRKHDGGGDDDESLHHVAGNTVQSKRSKGSWETPTKIIATGLLLLLFLCFKAKASRSE